MADNQHKCCCNFSKRCYIGSAGTLTIVQISWGDSSQYLPHLRCLQVTLLKCDVLRDLVPFVQFKNVKEKNRGVLILVKLQA